MLQKDLYRVLGVAPNADEALIRHAYRQALLRYHPDVYQGDPEVAEANTRELTEAYEVLVDPARRKAYDASLEGTSEETAPAPHARPPGSAAVRSTGATDSSLEVGAEVPSQNVPLWMLSQQDQPPAAWPRSPFEWAEDHPILVLLIMLAFLVIMVVVGIEAIRVVAP